MPVLGKARVGVPSRGRSWRARPSAALLVRVGMAGAPVVAAVTAGVMSAQLWPRPRSVAGLVGWWAASLGAAAAASYLVARAARRLLPLATLLRLSLALPDRIPSRFALALRAGTVSKLNERASRLAADGADVPTAQSAGEAIVLALALARHDRGTRGHSERVRALTDVIAEELGISSLDRNRLQWAGLLHDVGKVSVPSAILNKPGPLTEEEWQIMRRHPAEGRRLATSLTTWLGPWTDVISQHHERYDGSGYPDGLSGDQICLGARIVAVADTFDVMTSARSYKRPLPAAAAREEIVAKAGDLFDPGVVRALLSVSLGRLRWRSGPLAWVVAGPVFDRIDSATETLLPAAQSLMPTAPGTWVAAAAGAVAAGAAALVAAPVPVQAASPRSAPPMMVAVRQPVTAADAGSGLTAAPAPTVGGSTPAALDPSAAASAPGAPSPGAPPAPVIATPSPGTKAAPSPNATAGPAQSPNDTAGPAQSPPALAPLAGILPGSQGGPGQLDTSLAAIVTTVGAGGGQGTVSTASSSGPGRSNSVIGAVQGAALAGLRVVGAAPPPAAPAPAASQTTPPS